MRYMGKTSVFTSVDAPYSSTSKMVKLTYVLYLVFPEGKEPRWSQTTYLNEP
ncbi:hypothetical protein ES703_85005 [subsurface metagenome]